MPSKVIHYQTPFECLFHQPLEYFDLRVFDCAC
jgi:hypothetical protein